MLLLLLLLLLLLFSYSIQIDTGSCFNYYGGISEDCNFEVKEFGELEQAVLTMYLQCMAVCAHLSLLSSLSILQVLPKFEVKVEGPKYLTRDGDHIEGEVSAEYVCA